MSNSESQKSQILKKPLEGVVVKNVLQQTVTVLVESKRPHPIYKKYITHSKKFLVHVPEGIEINLGDYVQIEQTRPISKRKNFQIKSIIRTNNQ